jgi:beta-lactamase superfamily II metal-dependent hydrolase
MKPTHYLNIDLAKVYGKPERDMENYLLTLAWGDAVEVVDDSNKKFIEIRLQDFQKEEDGSILPVDRTGYIIISSSSKVKAGQIFNLIESADVLKVDFVDVQQGDGAVIETPQGKVMLIDGGDNQLFARYLASRFKGSSKKQFKDIECMLVTHGDADHFSGLVEIFSSESSKQANQFKKLFINPSRVYHNGLVKRPRSKPDKTDNKETEMLGKTIKDGNGQLYIQGLEDDLLSVDDSEMNKPFLAWKKALAHYKKRNGNLVIQRLDRHSENAFDFFEAEGINVQVLAPITHTIKNKTCLKFLHNPPKLIGTKQLKKEGSEITESNYSASHTINGHSIVLKLEYGNFSLLFTGDLNEESEEILTEESSQNNILQSHILKVPHHGSADFSNKFLESVNPLISIVSSGDESEQKEYIHPRATLMGALGKYSRGERPLIFVTELVAFFKREGWARVTEKAPKNATLEELREIYAFSRTAFGIVKVRCNGTRLLVYTFSGQKDLNEAYVFDLSNPERPERLDLLAV